MSAKSSFEFALCHDLSPSSNISNVQMLLFYSGRYTYRQKPKFTKTITTDFNDVLASTVAIFSLSSKKLLKL